MLKITFEKRQDAWDWMRYCEEVGHMVGYPHPTDDGKYSVKYIPNGNWAKN